MLELIDVCFRLKEAYHRQQHLQATIWRTVIGSPAGEEGDVVVVDFLAANTDVYREAVLNPIKLTVESVEMTKWELRKGHQRSHNKIEEAL